MDILKQVLRWSADRPAWQRDALRRLVTSIALTGDDYKALTELCKAKHGLAQGVEARPLASEHIARTESDAKAINLLSITHHHGVNALAEEQTVSFAPGLTVVYGDNAAGKSGYTRILKTACRTRGAEDILGNVLAENAPRVPSSSIRFRVGADGAEEIWPDKTESGALLGKVSVFDSHCAAVYLREKTDVAFRPFGLDLFDKLSNACEEVRKSLERERDALTAQEKPMPEVAENTATFTFLSTLSSLTSPERVSKLGTLSAEQQERLRFLKARLADLKAQDPAKIASALELRARRLRGLGRHLKTIDDVLEQEKLAELFAAGQLVQDKQAEAARLRAETFPDTLLGGTGSETWMTMWEAAKAFSEARAYGGEEFPFTGADALCVLCQQELSEEGKARMTQFQEFIVSEAEEVLRMVRDGFSVLRGNLEALDVTSDTASEAIQEVRLERGALADTLDAALESARLRRAAALKAIDQGTALPTALPTYELKKDEIETLIAQLTERAAGLRQATAGEELKKMQEEFDELAARVTVGENEALIRDEIERKKKIAVYELCLKDTQTYQITRMSTELTKETVTEQLKRAFREELESFRFRHVEVELQEVGGERGALYHKLVLKRAPTMAVPKVASEGEQRCLSIAAFFAELVTADDPSAILFDDPVSSLDHKWRSAVAQRLATEAKTRQVIVFTHDIVFLLALHKNADELGVPVHNQHVQRERLSAGVCDAELPWVAMKVRKRLGVLRDSWQAAEKAYRTKGRAAYEPAALLIYGRLRESWERGYEEVLLDGTVERYRENIQTQQVDRIADITDQDCEEFAAGMTKCSKWLHDQSPAQHEEMPDPDEVKTDIDALDQWVKRIRQRRN